MTLLRTHNIAPLFSGTDGLTDVQEKRLKELESEKATGVNVNGNTIKWTDAKKAELDGLLKIKKDFDDGNIELPAGAKTLINKCVKQKIYQYKPAFRGTRTTNKGNDVESAAIEFMNVQLLKTWKKSDSVLRYGDLVEGHPDIEDYDDCEIIDIKCPETKDSFPETVEDAVNMDYVWQVLMYLLMRGWTKGKIIHVLMSTPEELVFENESDDLHDVDHLDPRLRYTIVYVELDDKTKAHMERRLAAAEKYAAQRFVILNSKNK